MGRGGHRLGKRGRLIIFEYGKLGKVADRLGERVPESDSQRMVGQSE